MLPFPLTGGWMDDALSPKIHPNGGRPVTVSSRSRGSGGQWSTRQLTPDTWPDFVTLFSRGNGWDYCACMYFQRAGELPTRQFRTRADRQVQNMMDKCDLVEHGRAHGILVYDGESPIGWCQFGRVDELPVAELARRSATATTSPAAEWRITCFVTDKRYRKRSVASTALNAALAAIASSGGGLVEATPVAGWTRGHGAVQECEVDGLGAVEAARGTFGHVTTQGTVAMFERFGF